MRTVGTALMLLVAGSLPRGAWAEEDWRPMTATHYGVSYHGQRMGCGGVYDTADPTIAAVGPAWYGAWPCGTVLEVAGPAGTIEVVRQDSCPGCGAGLIDLSEAANAAVCGAPPHTCRVEVRRVEP